MKKIILLNLLAFCFSFANAQDTLRNKKNGAYLFTVKKSMEAMPVQDQSNTGTCWSFSALSFFESELIRLGKPKVKLSEMFIVYYGYIEKANHYIRMHGTSNFGQGGGFPDIPFLINKYGIVPESAYTGLQGEQSKHNHTELEQILTGMLKTIASNPKEINPAWKKAYSGILDAYLGTIPQSFEFNGKTYTPKTFASYIGLDMSQYVTISSYIHQPFYSQFILEVPDNWLSEKVYNVPIDELVAIADQSLNNGYTIAWAADVSEKGFSFKNGLAIVPLDENGITKTGDDNKHFNNAGADKKGASFDAPGPEKNITQEQRQIAFDNYQTTDDHGMHITGWVSDQTGKKYYITKNSWGKTSNDGAGYLYTSESYFKYKTMDIMIHKNALSSEMKNKLGIK